MRPGIKVIGEGVGTGDEVTKGKTVIINMRLLRIDERGSSNEVQPWRRLKVDLARRDADAGLRYGVEGMRVGGRRTFIVSPSLAGGNRPVRYEVELLEVRDDPYLTPEEYTAEIGQSN
jgi:hypothetical protein